MKIDLSSIIDKTENFIHLDGSLNLDSLDLGGRIVTVVGPIMYEGNIYRIAGQMAIDINITYRYKEACHRCLKPTTNDVKTTLSGKLAKGDYGDEEIEEDSGYNDIFFYENDVLDIEEYILNQVLFSLPMKSLCSSDCKGLCPNCGIDLNNEECNCNQENIDPRFEKLKNFFPNN